MPISRGARPQLGPITLLERFQLWLELELERLVGVGRRAQLCKWCYESWRRLWFVRLHRFTGGSTLTEGNNLIPRSSSASLGACEWPARHTLTMALAVSASPRTSWTRTDTTSFGPAFALSSIIIAIIDAVHQARAPLAGLTTGRWSATSAASTSSLSASASAIYEWAALTSASATISKIYLLILHHGTNTLQKPVGRVRKCCRCDGLPACLLACLHGLRYSSRVSFLQIHLFASSAHSNSRARRAQIACVRVIARSFSLLAALAHHWLRARHGPKLLLSNFKLLR